MVTSTAIRPDQGAGLWLHASAPGRAGAKVSRRRRVFARRTTSSLTTWVIASSGLVERVAAHRVEVRVARVPAENGKRRGAHHIGHATGAIAVVTQWAAFPQPRPAPARMQELRKENELPLARDRRIQVQLRVVAPAGRIHRPRWRRLRRSESALTRRVSAKLTQRLCLPSPHRLLARSNRLLQSRF